jgi:DNA-binding SARP family transcriptional activator/tetratricopeptide (TPR) repeat protein
MVSEIGELVRIRRLAAGLTQEELAGRAGVSVGTLRDLEQGRTHRPRSGLITRLDAVLDLAAGEVEESVGGAACADSTVAPVGAGFPAAGLWLRVLGPIEALRDGEPLALGPPRQRAVLGLLAMSAGTSVHRDALVDALWGQDPPAAALNEVQACVGRLRAVLDPERSPRDSRGLLVSAGTSYRLQLEHRELDWLAFRDLAGRAAVAVSAGETEVSLGLYERAMRLWRGVPLADVDALRGHPAVTEAHRVWAATVADFAHNAIASRQVELVLPDLWRWVERDPLNEKAHALLMIALAEAGQRAMALDVFADICGRLNAQLGLQPGPDLSAAHLRILRQEVLHVEASTDTVERLWAIPRQLPAAVRHFVGRDHELQVLTREADTPGVEGGVVPIVVISGTAGVGKTALALHWAHRNLEAFPDGQIFINLRGSDPAGPPVSRSDAVRLVIDALGIPAHRVPPDPQAQTALYRSVVAGRRVLIVLDNARDAEHARMLLPGSTGPMVVITSRDELTSLVAIEGAKPIRLSLLDADRSRDLIIRHLGVSKVTDQAEAVGELIALCGRLPLALSIVAARAAIRPDLPLSALVMHLRDPSGRLNQLSLGESAGDLRAVFSCSYLQLDAPAARMFRLNGLHPGPDISIHAAASLAGIAYHEAGRLLEQLTRAHLLTEQRPLRWEIHDLLRVYAAEQAALHDRDADRHNAIRRLLDHYLHTAHAAARLLEPACEALKLAPPGNGTTSEQVRDAAHARQWFATHHHTLMNIIAQAADTGHEMYAWQIAWTMVTWCTRRGLWADLATAQRIALDAARRTDDHRGQAHAHIFLGRASAALGRHDEAEDNLRRALELFHELGDGSGEGAAHLGFTLELDCQDQHLRALDHAAQFLELVRAAGDRIGEAVGLNNVGWLHARLGDHEQALQWCDQALELSHELGYRTCEARTLDSLGYAYQHLGRLTEAADHYKHALDVYQELDVQPDQVATLERLGDVQAEAGDLIAAQLSWRRAIHIIEHMGYQPAAQQIRDKMRRLEIVSDQR